MVRRLTLQSAVNAWTFWATVCRENPTESNRHWRDHARGVVTLLLEDA